MFYMFNMGTQITVRDVNKEVFREFKAEAIRRDLTLGTAITIAMKNFKQDLEKKRLKFTRLKPIDGGKGTERVSDEIDSNLQALSL